MLKICRSVSNGLLKPFVGRFVENLLNRKEDNHPSAYKADTNPWRALPPLMGRVNECRGSVRQGITCWYETRDLTRTIGPLPFFPSFNLIAVSLE